MWQLLVDNISDASAPGRADVPSTLLISEQHGMIPCRQDGLRCRSCGSEWSLQRSKRRITYCASKYHGVCNNAVTKCQPSKYYKQTKQAGARLFPENSEYFSERFCCHETDISSWLDEEKSSDIEEANSKWSALSSHYWLHGEIVKLLWQIGYDVIQMESFWGSNKIIEPLLKYFCFLLPFLHGIKRIT